MNTAAVEPVVLTTDTGSRPALIERNHHGFVVLTLHPFHADRHELVLTPADAVRLAALVLEVATRPGA